VGREAKEVNDVRSKRTRRGKHTNLRRTVFGLTHACNCLPFRAGFRYITVVNCNRNRNKTAL
jgi:hypothetical protein